MLSPDCIRTNVTYAEAKSVGVLVNSTTLYRIANVSNEMSYKEFYKKLRDLLYFDKYVCKHGTEFMYIVKFNVAAKEHCGVPKDVISVIGKDGIV